jgi:hypothetical protein
MINNFSETLNLVNYYFQNLLPITGYLLLSFVLFNSSLVLFKKGKKFINWYLTSVKENELIEEISSDLYINNKILKKIKFISSELKRINNRLSNIEKNINNKYSFSDISDDDNLNFTIKNNTGIFNNFFLTFHKDNNYLLKPFELSSSIKNINIGTEWNNELNGWVINKENVDTYLNQGAILMDKFVKNKKKNNSNNLLLSELSDNGLAVEKCLDNYKTSTSDSDVEINNLISKSKVI